MPNDEGGLIRTQPDDSRRYLLGLPHSSNRFLRDHSFSPFWGAPSEPLHHRSLDDTRAHSIDADVLWGVVESRRLGQADDAVLRGDVSRAPLETFDPSARRGVDDGAAALVEHQWDFVLHAQKNAAKINVNNSVPLLFRDVCHGLDGVFDTRIVEREIQPPERLDGRVQGLPYVLVPRHVTSEGERMPAEILDHAGCFLIILFGNVSHYHARALAGKRQRRRAADAVRCTGHERDLSCEVSFSVCIHLSAPFGFLSHTLW